MGDDRNHAVADNMTPGDSPLREPFGFGGDGIGLANDFEHGSTCIAHQPRRSPQRQGGITGKTMCRKRSCNEEGTPTVS